MVEVEVEVTGTGRKRKGGDQGEGGSEDGRDGGKETERRRRWRYNKRRWAFVGMRSVEWGRKDREEEAEVVMLQGRGRREWGHESWQ